MQFLKSKMTADLLLNDDENEDDDDDDDKMKDESKIEENSSDVSYFIRLLFHLQNYTLTNYFS